MSKIYTYETLSNELGTQLADRLAYIDFLLQFKGSVSRQELADFFGVKTASASSAMSEYKKLRSHNVDYNRSIGKNEILHTSFNPLLKIGAENALSMLANGFSKKNLNPSPLTQFDKVGELPRKLDVETVAKVTRAMNGKTGIECKYLSASSTNHAKRFLFPTAIFYDGISWMFRACHRGETPEKSVFKCFNFSRLESVTERHDIPASTHESIVGDADWNTMIPILLSPHPQLTEQQKYVLRYEYGFNDDNSPLALNIRAPLFYYLASHWKIDTRKTIENDQNCTCEYNFYLENRDSLQHFHCMENVIKN